MRQHVSSDVREVIDWAYSGDLSPAEVQRVLADSGVRLSYRTVYYYKPGARKSHLAYYLRPDVKAARRSATAALTPEQREHRRSHHRDYMRQYRQRPDVQASRSAHNVSYMFERRHDPDFQRAERAYNRQRRGVDKELDKGKGWLARRNSTAKYKLTSRGHEFLDSTVAPLGESAMRVLRVLDEAPANEYMLAENFYQRGTYASRALGNLRQLLWRLYQNRLVLHVKRQQRMGRAARA